MRDSGLERLQAAVTSIVRPYLLKLFPLIFILEGEVEIIPKEGKIKRVIAQEFFFISALSTYEIQVRVPGRYIYMSFLYNDIKTM